MTDLRRALYGHGNYTLVAPFDKYNALNRRNDVVGCCLSNMSLSNCGFHQLRAERSNRIGQRDVDEAAPGSTSGCGGCSLAVGAPSTRFCISIASTRTPSPAPGDVCDFNAVFPSHWSSAV